MGILRNRPKTKAMRRRVFRQRIGRWTRLDTLLTRAVFIGIPAGTIITAIMTLYVLYPYLKILAWR